MNKKTITILFLTFCNTAIGQCLNVVKNYLCKNGFEVTKGDTIFLAKPSNENGTYKSIFKDKQFGKDEHLTKENNENFIVVEKIICYNSGSDKEFAYLLGDGVNISNYTIDIEKAIVENEISIPDGYVPIKKRINNPKSYTASNGITYNVGDLIELGRGSNSDGSFVHLRLSGWALALDPKQNTSIGAVYTGQKVKIKSIMYEKSKRLGYEKVWMMVGGGNITNYSIDLESAIKSCEVVPCNDVSKVQVVNNNTSTADEIKKLYELKKEGVLTEEEFKQQKDKLLSK